MLNFWGVGDSAGLERSLDEFLISEILVFTVYFSPDKGASNIAGAGMMDLVKTSSG